MVPHALLYEGATYIIFVHIDSYKGPGNLEGGQWVLELFGSSEVEVGADTTEQDLEVLVRKSWEDPNQDPLQPLRKDRALASRKSWLRKRGLGGTPSVESNADPAEAEGGGGGDDSNAEALAEAAELAAAMARAEQTVHANDVISDFIHRHTTEDPVLIVEDPYTIAPDPPMELGKGCEPEDGGETSPEVAV